MKKLLLIIGVFVVFSPLAYAKGYVYCTRANFEVARDDQLQNDTGKSPGYSGFYKFVGETCPKYYLEISKDEYLAQQIKPETLMLESKKIGTLECKEDVWTDTYCESDVVDKETTTKKPLKDEEDVLRTKVYEILMKKYLTYSDVLYGDNKYDKYFKTYSPKAFAACYDWDKISKAINSSNLEYPGKLFFGWWATSELNRAKNKAMEICKEGTSYNCKCDFLDINDENVIELPKYFIAKNITTKKDENERLKKLKLLFDQNLITQDEYEKKRREINADIKLKKLEEIKVVKVEPNTLKKKIEQTVTAKYDGEYLVKLRLGIYDEYIADSLIADLKKGDRICLCNEPNNSWNNYHSVCNEHNRVIGNVYVDYNYIGDRISEKCSASYVKNSLEQEKKEKEEEKRIAEAKKEDKKTTTTKKEEEKLNKLQSWYDKGLITKEEYNQKRKELLGESSTITKQKDTKLKDLEDFAAKYCGNYSAVDTNLGIKCSNRLHGAKITTQTVNTKKLYCKDTHGQVFERNTNTYNSCGYMKEISYAEYKRGDQKTKVVESTLNKNSLKEELKYWKDLFDEELITKEEYDEKRKELLSGTSTP